MSGGSIARTIAKEHGGKTSEALRVPVDALYFDPKYDLREEVGDIEWIENNIRESGYWAKEPIEVRPHKDSKKLEIVDGRRRYRACKNVHESGNMGNWDGMIHIVPQFNMSDVDMVFKTLNSNNDSRKPFTMMEEGSHFLMLQNEFKIEPEEICKRIGKSITYVSDRIALASVDSDMKADFQSYIRDGKLSSTAAAKIAKISDPKERERVWKEAKNNHNNQIRENRSEETPKETIINGQKVHTVTDEKGREKVVHPVTKKKEKIKIKDVLKSSRKGPEHISIKTVKSNLEFCEKMYQETKTDYWEGRVTVLKAVLENRVIES